MNKERPKKRQHYGWACGYCHAHGWSDTEKGAQHDVDHHRKSGECRPQPRWV